MYNELPLKKLSIQNFLDTIKNSEPVLCGYNHRNISKVELLSSTKKLCNWLEFHTSKNWILHTNSIISFVQGLLALMLSGKTIYFPVNAKSGTLNQIDCRDASLLTDNKQMTFQGESYQIDQLIDNYSHNESVNLAIEFSTHLLDEVKLCFFTSGSTNTAKLIVKTVVQIEEEISVLEYLWGRLLSKSVYMSSVSHQHMYGFCFRVFWPLLSGRSIDTCCYQYHEQLSQGMLMHENVTFITSPSYLERLPKNTCAEAFAGQVSGVFSSCSELKACFIKDVVTSMGKVPVEIFGSTETGVVAYRQQVNIEKDEFWNTLPKVNVLSKNGNLIVSSQWCCKPEGFSMGDIVKMFPGQRFKLLGRADCITKIEGKRVSLGMQSKYLIESSLVEKAEMIILSQGRTQIGAVIVLSSKGNVLLEKQGRHNVIQRLKKQLSSYFENVTLPKKWRFVKALPRNSQGKVLKSELVELFKIEQTDLPRRVIKTISALNSIPEI